MRQTSCLNGTETAMWSNIWEMYSNTHAQASSLISLFSWLMWTRFFQISKQICNCGCVVFIRPFCHGYTNPLYKIYLNSELNTRLCPECCYLNSTILLYQFNLCSHKKIKDTCPSQWKASILVMLYMYVTLSCNMIFFFLRLKVYLKS